MCSAWLCIGGWIAHETGVDGCGTARRHEHFLPRLLVLQPVLGLIAGQGLLVEVAHKTRWAVASVTCSCMCACQHVIRQAQRNRLALVQSTGAWGRAFTGGHVRLTFG